MKRPIPKERKSRKEEDEEEEQEEKQAGFVHCSTRMGGKNERVQDKGGQAGFKPKTAKNGKGRD